MVVLFGVSIGAGHAVNGSYDGSIPRSATRNNKPCRKLYSFRDLDYENLGRACAYKKIETKTLMCGILLM